MNIKRVKFKLILPAIGLALAAGTEVLAQVVDKGLPPAANTFRSFQDASVARDSELNRPLDLLHDFYPAITVTISDRDNARRRPDFDEEDVVITVQPTLAYRTNIGRHQFYAAYNGTYNFHHDLTQEDAESNVLSAQLGLDLTRRWDLDLFASYGESFEERGVSGSRDFNQFAGNGIDSGPETVDSLGYGVDLTFGRKIGVITAVLGYDYLETGFSDGDLFNGANSSDRDRETESVHFDLNWQFASQTSVFGRVQYSETNFDLSAPNLDSDEYSFLIGLRFKPSNALSGVVGAGRTVRDFDDTTRDSFDGSTYYVNLSYSFNPFSTISFNASRFVEEPGDIDASFYDSELFGVSWSHALNRKFTLEAFGKLVDDDYDTGREDEFVDWGVGVEYNWRSWLSAGLFYGETERDSNLDNIDFEDKFFSLRFRSDLRSLLTGGRNRRIEPGSFNYPVRTQPTQ